MRHPRRLACGAGYDEACADLTRELEALTDTGEPVVTEVVRSDQVFGDRYHPNLPDLIVKYRGEGVITSVSSPRIGTVSEEARGADFARSGEHTSRVRLCHLGPAAAQTWQNFELVVVDDGSTDSTLEVGRSYSDPRIRVESNASNVGSAGTHNRAIELSRGSYIKFLHADDRLAPDCLAAMVELAEEDPRIGLVFGAREVVAEGADEVAWSTAYATSTSSSAGSRASTTATFFSTSSSTQIWSTTGSASRARCWSPGSRWSGPAPSTSRSTRSSTSICGCGS